MTGRVKIHHLPAKMRPVWPTKKTIDIERRLIFGARGIAISKPSNPPRPRPGLALFLIPMVSQFFVCREDAPLLRSVGGRSFLGGQSRRHLSHDQTRAAAGLVARVEGAASEHRRAADLPRAHPDIDSGRESSYAIPPVRLLKNPLRCAKDTAVTGVAFVTVKGCRIRSKHDHANAGP